MTNEILEKIKKYAVSELKRSYGFCGVAEGKDAAIINSSDSYGNDIKITIELEKEK